MSDLPYSHMISVADLPPLGLHLKLEPDAETTAALARHVGVLHAEGIVAALHLVPEGKEGVRVSGRLKATVRQTCGVTLEPFDAPLAEEIDVHFAPAGSYVRSEEDEENGIDPPDEIVDGQVDVGALVCEFLALGVDPYPRKPGAVFEPPAEDAAALSPFSALSRLKDKE